MTQKRIGIVGGGQLGRLLTMAAKNLGFTVTILDPTPQSPAGLIADKQIVGSFKDESKIKELAQESDFLTFEIELANSKVLEEISREIPVNPSPKTLEIIKDKFRQKQFLQKAGIPIPRFKEIKGTDDIKNAAAEFNYPLVLKAKFDAYDGRGNATIEKEEDIEKALQKLSGRELYVEEFIPFEKELAVVAARGMNGEIKVYPVVETVHKDHICDTVIAPAGVSEEAKKQAANLALSVLEHLQGVGVFAIEMFYTNGKVLVNEIAPRVHNSGHLTLEACQTSQFEQHIRAVTRMELGATQLKFPAAIMKNILGERDGAANFPDYDGLLEHLPGIKIDPALYPNVYAHIYGKIETKTQRKMGHLTAVGDNVETLLETIEQARSLISI